MQKKYKLGVIGGGFMAHAFVKGVVGGDYIEEDRIIVSSRSAESLEKFKEFEIKTTTDNAFVADNCEFLLLAVKPQVFATVAEDIKNSSVKKVISIMAAITISDIKSAFNGEVSVCRCMPNTPCTVREGAIGADMSEFTLKDKAFLNGLFACLGEVVEVEEQKLHAVTGISGSGPVYVYSFIKALKNAGVKNGLTEAEALKLSVQTVYGAVAMIEDAGESLDELIAHVCSKGGTTVEAMKSFEEDDFAGSVARAVNASVRRSKELSDR